MAESENIFILATDDHAYFSLQLAVTPAVRERVSKQDLGDEKVAGAATRLEWRGLSKTSVAVPVRVEDHLDGVHKCDSAHGWEGLTYIPVPRQLVDTTTPTTVVRQAETLEVSPIGHLHGTDKPWWAVCPVWACQISRSRVSEGRLVGTQVVISTREFSMCIYRYYLKPWIASVLYAES